MKKTFIEYFALSLAFQLFLSTVVLQYHLYKTTIFQELFISILAASILALWRKNRVQQP